MCPFCTLDKRENLPKRITNEDLSCTGQGENVQAAEVFGGIFLNRRF